MGLPLPIFSFKYKPGHIPWQWYRATGHSAMCSPSVPRCRTRRTHFCILGCQSPEWTDPAECNAKAERQGGCNPVRPREVPVRQLQAGRPSYGVFRTSGLGRPESPGSGRFRGARADHRVWTVLGGSEIRPECMWRSSDLRSASGAAKKNVHRTNYTAHRRAVQRTIISKSG